MSRRAFLSSGAVGAAAVALGGAVSAKADGPANDVDAMVLQVAAAAAVFPVSLQSREGVSPRSRLTPERVARAWKRCSPERARQARRGAELLLDYGLGGVDRETLLARLGEIVDGGSDDTIANLRALVAVAGVTLVDRADPASDQQAKIWLAGLAIMHRKGAKPTVGAAA